MEPLIRDGTLVSWPPEFAAERYRWHMRAVEILKANGFQEVVTPHLYRKPLQREFEGWFGRVESYPYVFEKVEGREECQDYIPLGNKSLLHVPIFRRRPHSYKELPIRYFEIGEAYKGSPISNMIGVHLTVFCEPKDEKKERDLIVGLLTSIRPLSEFISSHSGEYHNGLSKDLYIADDNSKKQVFALMAAEYFIGRP